MHSFTYAIKVFDNPCHHHFISAFVKKRLQNMHLNQIWTLVYCNKDCIIMLPYSRGLILDKANNYGIVKTETVFGFGPTSHGNYMNDSYNSTEPLEWIITRGNFAPRSLQGIFSFYYLVALNYRFNFLAKYFEFRLLLRFSFVIYIYNVSQKVLVKGFTSVTYFFQNLEIFIRILKQLLIFMSIL